MEKKTVFLTGATGGMGQESLHQLLEERDSLNLILLARDSKKNREILKPYENDEAVEIVWGDLTLYEDVYKCVEKSDLVIHIAAFVSPQADYYPKKAMKTNFGSTKNIVDAIVAQNRQEEVKLVFIGTIAMTGDRMPPIHWGRIGDPIKPSMFDYYAVSKVASERYVIESGIRDWVSLRQTGIMGPAMAKVKDAIMFHNPFDNVLEYVSDRDSGRMIKNLCKFTQDGTLDTSFWGHVYNIGGGERTRVSGYELYKGMYGSFGLERLDLVLKPKMVATRNFHGHYYLDSDKLENYLHFRSDPIQYAFDSTRDAMGKEDLEKIQKAFKLPFGQRLVARGMRKDFEEMARGEHGTIRFIEENMEDHIEAYWGSKKAWEKLPNSLNDMNLMKDFSNVIRLDHGYDEDKPEEELTYEDMKGAAEFRGGVLDSEEMKQGDWTTKLDFTCQFGHKFSASPRLVLEGGHWCDQCERESWNYGERAKKDRFFAQVWEPLHEKDELREYPKTVNELDIDKYE